MPITTQDDRSTLSSDASTRPWMRARDLCNESLPVACNYDPLGNYPGRKPY